MDQTIGIILIAFLVVVPALSTILRVEDRRAFRRVDRKPEILVVGSMRPEEWPPTEFKR
jgi:hypothetical protein